MTIQLNNKSSARDHRLSLRADVENMLSADVRAHLMNTVAAGLLQLEATDLTTIQFTYPVARHQSASPALFFSGVIGCATYSLVTVSVSPYSRICPRHV